MIKLVAMYKTPADIEMFEKHYFEKHMPIVEKIPGLLRSEVSKLKILPGTESEYYMMTEMYYDDMDSFGNYIDSFRVEFKIPEEFLLKISEYIDSKIYDVLENEYKEYLNTVKQNWINNRKIELGLRSEKYYES